MNEKTPYDSGNVDRILGDEDGPGDGETAVDGWTRGHSGMS